MTDLAEVPQAPAPAWGDILSLQTDDWHELPDVTTPYYIHASDGHFRHSRTDAGRWVTKVHKVPSKLKPIGNYQGVGTFDGQVIPASIYAQAVAFFRRVYDAHHTEAEVLILQHRTTKEYRLFVPTQRVSHGGVYSIYNPRHISREYLVVGTFHSHCDFDPYHSSTDEGDARDMDGIHGTIGFLKSDQPGLALMVASNGVFFNFKDVTDVVDTSDLTAGTAPEFWDRYMVFGTVTDAQRPAWADDETWDRYMGRYKKPVTQFKAPVRPPTQRTPTGFQAPQQRQFKRWEASDVAYLRSRGWLDDSEQLRESTEFNAGLALLPDGRDEGREFGDDWWEDALGAKFVDSLFASSLFTEDDLDVAVDNYPESATPEFWIKRFTGKLFAAADWLATQGVAVKLDVKDKRKTPVKGQTTVDEFITPITTGAPE